jgi:malonyl-CoA decarboxylase
MSKSSFLSDILNNLLNRKNLLKPFIRAKDTNDNYSVEDLVHNILNAKGEASANVFSEQLLGKIENLNQNQLIDFFNYLAEYHDIDGTKLLEEVKKFNLNKSPENLDSVIKRSEPIRVEILSKLNSSERGTNRLVKLREKLLLFLKDKPNLKRVDNDFVKLFKNWFNNGFLVLKQIGWSTPALILEKVIEYEAVHEIASWKDLRDRLEPDDRLCFSFFHPSMQDEPLIFVVVALMDKVPENIEEVLSNDRKVISKGNATTAVFYSISNCQKGLKGISFGNFLIKQVAQAIRTEYPNIKDFVTLSPVPDFMKWLKLEKKHLYKRLKDPSWVKDTENYKEEVIENSLDYFFISSRPDRLPNDSVARFHLGNGAILDRINFMGDESVKALSSAAGLMVNYRYNIDSIEQNHEEYFKNKTIICSQSIKTLKKSFANTKKYKIF